jgi:hypothetical protein
MSSRLIAPALVLVALATGCGSGGGGTFVAPGSLGPVDWGIPFLGGGSSRTTWMTFHNLDREPTTVAFDAYDVFGAYVTGGVGLTLDGYASRHVEFSPALSLAWVHAFTPSRRVDVGFLSVDDSAFREEASRAWPLVDLMAPPAGDQRASVFVNGPTRRVQVTNASALATMVSITRFEEPIDPLLPPTEFDGGSVSLDPFESYVFDPASVYPGFFGKILFESATPLFAATEDPLSFGDMRWFTRLDRSLFCDVRFGLDSVVPERFQSFEWLLRNDSSDAQDVVLQQVRGADGFAILPSPRVITLAPKESRVVSTFEFPFDDLFGDPVFSPGLVRARLEAFVPSRVMAAVRQFDPEFPSDLATTPMQPQGHVIDSYQVFPSEFLDDPVRTFYTVQNPAQIMIEVTIQSVVTEPDGFEASVVPLATLTIPPRGFAEFSPDGVVYLDRDLVPASPIALRFASAASFALTGRRETRDASRLLISLTPTIIRVDDDAR